MTAKAETASSQPNFLKYWPQAAATLLALLVAAYAFRGHYQAKIQTDKDLEAFLSETYLREVDDDAAEEVETVDTDYFNLAN